ncbi:MAG: peptide chain release factor 1 [Clostridia bacterium]|nr:peptide chain release factor 1 [Clostridia bacterium]
MLKKLEKVKTEYDRISADLSDPDIIADQTRLIPLMKKHSELQEIVTMYEEYLSILKEKEDLLKMLEEEKEGELASLAEAELSDLNEREEELQKELIRILAPKDPNDGKNAILEIRAGTGGDEAALFANDLLRMYTRYSERHGFKLEVLSSSITGLGGVKEIILLVKGRDVFSKLKYESGVHRVQRIPETETSGRIHTSAATVAVLPEAEAVDVQIDPQDLRIDVYHSSGHGGQSVNTTDSAVRVTYLPTGMIVTCQDEKSQLKNKEKAMKVLYSRLYDLKKKSMDDEYSKNRKDQVGSGDRSERIRTYNFPQGRVTDHRVGITLYKLDVFLDGDMDEIIEALINKDIEERIKEVSD